MGHDTLPVSKCSYCIRPFQTHIKHRRHSRQHLKFLCATQARSLQLPLAPVVRGKQQLPQQDTFLFAVVEWLFGFQPLWEAAKHKVIIRSCGVVWHLLAFIEMYHECVRVRFLQARDKIASRGEMIGVDKRADVAVLKAAVPSWEVELEAVESQLTMPEYYTMPFHAYEDGNLCWQAAFEVSSCAMV